MLLFVDSFDHYATGDFTKKYNTSAGVTINFGRHSTNGVKVGIGGQLYKSFTNNYTTLIMGGAVYVASFSNTVIFAFTDNTTIQTCVFLNSAGKLEIRRGESSILATSTQTLSLNTWYYVELKTTFNNTTGSATLMVNGEIWASVENVDTQATGNSSANGIKIGSTTQVSKEFYIDDLYVCDTSGTVANNFLGDVRISALYPNANDTPIQWTPYGVTNNYEAVDESPSNYDTDYNYTATSGYNDIFQFSDLPVASGSIYGVQLLCLARKDDGGSRYLRLLYKPGTTIYNGTNVFSLSDTYTYVSEIKETNPDTGTNWTISDINSAKFGYKSEG